MSQSIHLFTRLKNTDLACLSAEDAIKSLLKFQPLRKLTRYTFWELEFSDIESSTAIQKVQSILETSFYLANPNKEEYILSYLPKKIIKNDETLLMVKTFDPNSIEQRTLCEKILRKTGIKIQKIQKSTAWEFVIEKGTDSLDAIQKN